VIADRRRGRDRSGCLLLSLSESLVGGEFPPAFCCCWGRHGWQLHGNDFKAAYAPNVTLDGSNQTVGLLEFDGYYLNDITTHERQAQLPNVPLQNVLLDGVSGVPSTNTDWVVEVSLDTSI
jgi:hypothetical protein